MIKVIVLAGGNSTEREVSLRSGRVIASSLKLVGFDVTLIDPVEPFSHYLNQFKSTDIIFPAVHGHGGEDGRLQAFLEAHKLKFVGSGSKASRLCFDKHKFLELMMENNILVPETQIVTLEQFNASQLIKSPFVLKPIDEGSSIDTLIVKDVGKLNVLAIEKVFSAHPTMLLEPFIDGHEITVGVVGDKPLPVVEIIPPSEEDFNYENKYNGKTLELCPPKNISLKVQQTAQSLSLKIHRLCECKDMSRTDMIMATDRSLFVLETNTIPGLTSQSLLPKAAMHAGLDMPQLCKQLVEMALA